MKQVIQMTDSIEKDYFGICCQLANEVVGKIANNQSQDIGYYDIEKGKIRVTQLFILIAIYFLMDKKCSLCDNAELSKLTADITNKNNANSYSPIPLEVISAAQWIITKVRYHTNHITLNEFSEKAIWDICASYSDYFLIENPADSKTNYHIAEAIEELYDWIVKVL